eukprot:scaffold239413_cov31-Tisochrysis_lutea.AAC.2
MFHAVLTSGPHAHRLEKLDLFNRFHARTMAASAAESLLVDFGFSAFSSASSGNPACERSPMGPEPSRARNSWHEAIVCFALLSTRALGSGGESALQLVNNMRTSYECGDGLLAHLPSREWNTAHSEQLIYIGTQAVWSAALRAANADIGSEDDAHSRRSLDRGMHENAFRLFCADNIRDGLLPVSNLHDEIRLWPNAQLATWLLLEPMDFL